MAAPDVRKANIGCAHFADVPQGNNVSSRMHLVHALNQENASGIINGTMSCMNPIIVAVANTYFE